MRNVLEPTVPIEVGALSQRRRIVDAMIESCAEKTYGATTIADIVRRAGISRTTFYKRFSGKRECFDAALDWCIEELRAAAAASRSPADAPPEAVRKAVAALLGLMAEQPALAQLVLGEAVTVDPAVVWRCYDLLVQGLAAVGGEGFESRQPADALRRSFGRAQILVYDLVAAGDSGKLRELQPELVYVALFPYTGHEEALREARLTLAAAAPSPGGDG